MPAPPLAMKGTFIHLRSMKVPFIPNTDPSTENGVISCPRR